MSPDDKRHGTTAGFSAGCREACCREVRNADERRRRKQRQVLGIERLIDGTGTTRRIQALWAIGWTSADIARECGWSTPQAVTEIVSTRRGTYRATAATIAAAYERLSMTPGPSAITRSRALRAGYAPPLAWDDIDNDPKPYRGHDDRTPDPVVVDRILAGDWTLARTANKAERVEVVRRWRAAGRSTNELDRLTGWRAHRYIEGDGEAA